jgi:hypothetical protein
MRRGLHRCNATTYSRDASLLELDRRIRRHVPYQGGGEGYSWKKRHGLTVVLRYGQIQIQIRALARVVFVQR